MPVFPPTAGGLPPPRRPKAASLRAKGALEEAAALRTTFAPFGVIERAVRAHFWVFLGPRRPIQAAGSCVCCCTRSTLFARIVLLSLRKEGVSSARFGTRPMRSITQMLLLLPALHYGNGSVLVYCFRKIDGASVAA